MSRRLTEGAAKEELRGQLLSPHGKGGETTPQGTMTVAQLIAQLQRFEPTWPVLCQDDLALRSPNFVTEGTERLRVDDGQTAREEYREYPVVMIF